MPSPLWSLRSFWWCKPRINHVFPMPMGMNRVEVHLFWTCSCVPHAYGDEPVYSIKSWIDCSCSPCLWGWTAWDRTRFYQERVFPMPMGMNRYFDWWDDYPLCVPHARKTGASSRIVTLEKRGTGKCRGNIYDRSRVWRIVEQGMQQSESKLLLRCNYSGVISINSGHRPS